MTTTNSTLPEITGGNGAEATDHNMALQMLDILVQHAVVDHSLTTAPTTGLANGQGYVIAGNGGNWSGFTTGNLAGRINGAWVEIPVRNGHRVVSDIDGAVYEKSGSSWSASTFPGSVASVNGATGTVVLDPDDLDDSATTNKFTTAGDISKLAGIETAADVTDETNVVAALSGATLTDVGTPAATDKILLLDASDADNLKYADFSEFAGSVDINGLTEEPGFTSGDFLVFYDATAGTNRKVDYDDLPGATAGDAWGDPVDADIVPDTDSTWDLGSSANRFAELYVDDVTVTTTIQIGGGLWIEERADHAETPTAGKAELWVRNDAPNTLMFTDDAGTDFQINRHQGALVKLASNKTGQNYSAGTAIPWDAEEYDTDSIHDNATNNARLTVPSGWTKVKLTASVFATNATSGQTSALTILKNGSSTLVPGLPTVLSRTTTEIRNNVVSAVVAVTGGTDYFEVILYSGGDTSIDLQADGCFFAMERVE